MSYVYLGRWKWVEDDDGARWQPPQGCEWALDLRSVPQMSKRGGEPEGYGVFSLKEPGEKAGVLLDKAAVQNELGLAVLGEKPEDIIWELLIDHADPTGNSFARPIMPGKDLQMKLRLGPTVMMEAFDPFKHQMVIPAIQDDYRKLRANSLASGSNHYLKVLGALGKKYKLPAETFIPADLPKETPLTPATTITDDFNRASLGTDWTVVDGNWDIYNSDDIECTGSAGSFPSSIRNNNALSGDDQYAQIVGTYAGGVNAFIAPALRFNTSDETYYSCYQMGSSGVAGRQINKVINGTRTVLTSDATQVDVPFTTKLTVDGSSLEMFIDGGSVLSTTDSSITGYTNAGLAAHNQDTSRGDDFEAADLGPEEKTSQETGTGVEASLARATLIAGDAGQGAEYAQILGLWEVLFGSDNGRGSDSLRALIARTGPDMKLRPDHGRVGLPHKEVNL